MAFIDLEKYRIQKIEWICMRPKQTFITRTTQIFPVKKPWKTSANVTQGFAQMNTEQSYTHRIKSNLVTLDLILYTCDLWANWKRKVRDNYIKIGSCINLLFRDNLWTIMTELHKFPFNYAATTTLIKSFEIWWVYLLC